MESERDRKEEQEGTDQQGFKRQEYKADVCERAGGRRRQQMLR